MSANRIILTVVFIILLLITIVGFALLRPNQPTSTLPPPTPSTGGVGAPTGTSEPPPVAVNKPDCFDDPLTARKSLMDTAGWKLYESDIFSMKYPQELTVIRLMQNTFSISNALGHSASINLHGRAALKFQAQHDRGGIKYLVTNEFRDGSWYRQTDFIAPKTPCAPNHFAVTGQQLPIYVEAVGDLYTTSWTYFIPFTIQGSRAMFEVKLTDLYYNRDQKLVPEESHLFRTQIENMLRTVEF